jgi:hypothetical protein
MTGTDLRLSALEQFPNAYIVIRDNNYNVPTIEEVRKLLKITFIEDYQYKVDKFDCDDFALIFDGFCKQQQYFNNKSKPDAIGQVYIVRGVACLQSSVGGINDNLLSLQIFK